MEGLAFGFDQRGDSEDEQGDKYECTDREGLVVKQNMVKQNRNSLKFPELFRESLDQSCFTLP